MQQDIYYSALLSWWDIIIKPVFNFGKTNNFKWLVTPTAYDKFILWEWYSMFGKYVWDLEGWSTVVYLRKIFTLEINPVNGIC